MADPLTYLLAAHKRAEELADDFADPWRAVDTPFGPEVHIGTGDDMDGKWSRESVGVDAAYRCDDPDDDCDSARAGYLAEARLIAEHGNPAAVLRRIAAERKILAAHRVHECGDSECALEPRHRREFCDGCRPGVIYPCPTVRALAEAWGCQEAGQR